MLRWDMPRILEDLTGRSYGSWTVTGRAPDVPTVKETIWACRCTCGTVQDVPRSNLLRGRSTKCLKCRDAAARKPVKPKRYRLVGQAARRARKDVISYSTAHKRVATDRGRAADHPCSNQCGNQADSWAYRGGAELELIEERPSNHIKKTVRYSANPADYDPMCWSCHARKDAAEARREAPRTSSE